MTPSAATFSMHACAGSRGVAGCSSSASPPDAFPEIPANRLLLKRCLRGGRLLGLVCGAVIPKRIARISNASLRARRVEGALAPKIGARYPLAERRARHGRHGGAQDRRKGDRHDALRRRFPTRHQRSTSTPISMRRSARIPRSSGKRTRVSQEEREEVHAATPGSGSWSARIIFASA